jgi:hypothetical protein
MPYANEQLDRYKTLKEKANKFALFAKTLGKVPSNGLISSPCINIVTHGADFWDTVIILFFELSTLHKNQIYLGYFTASILYLQKLCLIVKILKILKFAIFNDDIYFGKFKKVFQHLKEGVKFEDKFFCESALINQN